MPTPPPVPQPIPEPTPVPTPGPGMVPVTAMDCGDLDNMGMFMSIDPASAQAPGTTEFHVKSVAVTAVQNLDYQIDVTSGGQTYTGWASGNFCDSAIFALPDSIGHLKSDSWGCPWTTTG